MDWNSFIKSDTYKELETFLKYELIDKPLDIDTKGKSAEEIALEVKASEVAAKKILKLFRKMKLKGGEIKEIKPFTGI